MKNQSNPNMSNNNNNNNNNNNQDSGCKIFIGGLTWNTTKDMLHSEFSKYGEIVDSIVMKNPETDKSRGFGFVTYKENSSADEAVNSGSHKIDGKIVDVKLCNPKLAAQQRNIKQKTDNCKVFVGGLPHGVTDNQIKQFFTRYGTVKEFKMMYDENKQRPRGFGFITFETEECANQVLQEHYIQFNGKQIEVKPQIHNLKQQMPYHQHHQMQYQQAHFGGNWNSQWNQPQLVQPMPLGQPMPMGSNPNVPGAYGGMMPQGYNTPMPNTPGMNQQWGYPTHGSQPHPYAGNVPNNAIPQSNWNYQYYGQAPQQQQQPGYYQQHPQQQPQPQQGQPQQQQAPSQQPPQLQQQQSDSSGTGTFSF